MRVRLPLPALSVFAAFVWAACSTGGPGPSVLAYGLPDPSVLTYVTGDSVTLEVGAGGQTFNIAQNSRARLETSFDRAGEGVEVTLRVRELSGTMTQPMGAPLTTDEGSIQGPLVFTLGRRGDVEVVSQPEVSIEATTFFSPLVMAHSFFPALPARTVEIGDTWVDTVSFTGPQGPGEVTSLSVLTYTVTRDTVLAGRSVVRIDVGGTTESETRGLLQDLEFTQNLSGDVEGYVLWDMSRRAMVENHATGDLNGQMEIDIAPFPLTLRVRVQSTARLQS